MWFRQIQVFQLTHSINSSAQQLAEKLEPYAFQSCLPSMPQSAGWVAPIDEENMPLTRGLNGCIMVCLQIEDKILPASVVNLELKNKIKQMELAEGRRIGQKEKMSWKDEVTQTLMTQAFSKLTRMNAYIDTRNQWLVLNSTSSKKTELFLSQIKKALGDCLENIEVVKLSSVFTSWLKDKEYPTQFAIEKSCVLQDPDQQNRVIRCQQQDLFASGIQALLKEGCEAIQLALNWHDKMDFVLADDFTMRSIRLSDDDIVEIQDEMETKQQKFDADFIMMTEMYAGLINDLLAVFAKKNEGANVAKMAMVG